MLHEGKQIMRSKKDPLKTIISLLNNHIKSDPKKILFCIVTTAPAREDPVRGGMWFTGDVEVSVVVEPHAYQLCVVKPVPHASVNLIHDTVAALFRFQFAHAWRMLRKGLMHISGTRILVAGEILEPYDLQEAVMYFLAHCCESPPERIQLIFPESAAE
jgi:hypothetical protein